MTGIQGKCGKYFQLKKKVLFIVDWPGLDVQRTKCIYGGSRLIRQGVRLVGNIL